MKNNITKQKLKLKMTLKCKRPYYWNNITDTKKKKYNWNKTKNNITELNKYITEIKKWNGKIGK